MPRRKVVELTLDEQIAQAEARAAEACRNHDPAAEYAAEVEFWRLTEQAAHPDEPIPEQR